MADLKRCDRCKEIWEPDLTHDYTNGKIDPNLVTISITIPRDPARTGNDAEQFNENAELCRKCGLFFKAELTEKTP